MNLISNKDFTILGRPTVDNCQIICSVLENGQAEHMRIFKKKRRKRYKKTVGHTQLMTTFLIEQIRFDVSPEMAQNSSAIY